MSDNPYLDMIPQANAGAVSLAPPSSTGNPYLDMIPGGNAAPTDEAPPEADPGKWQNPVMERVRQIGLGLGHAVAHPIETAGKLYEGAKDIATLPGEVYQGTADLNDPATMDRAIGMGLAITPGAPIGAAAQAAREAEAIGSRAGKVFEKRPPAPSVKDLKAAGGADYKAAFKTPVNVNPEGVQKLAADVGSAMTEFGYHPKLQTAITPAIEELGNIAKRDQNNPSIYFHGTYNDFNTFKPGEEGAVFATKNKDIASGYGNKVVPITADIKNPLEIDWEKVTGQKDYSIPLMRDLISNAKDAGHDVLVIHNIRDAHDAANATSTQYAFLKPEQLQIHKDQLSSGATLKELDTIRRIAGHARTNIDSSTRAAADLVTEKIDEFLQNLKPEDIVESKPFASASLPEATTKGAAHIGGSFEDANTAVQALKQAQTEWRTARKTEMIQQIIDNAQNTADASGSGGNINNALRQGFKNLLNNPKKARNFNSVELSAMRAITKGASLDNVARLVGKLGPSGNGLTLAINAAHGAVSPATGIPLAIAGTAAKKYADMATRNKANAALGIVAGGGKEPLKAGSNVIVTKFGTFPRTKAGARALAAAASGKAAIAYPQENRRSKLK